MEGTLEQHLEETMKSPAVVGVLCTDSQGLNLGCEQRHPVGRARRHHLGAGPAGSQAHLRPHRHARGVPGVRQREHHDPEARHHHRGSAQAAVLSPGGQRCSQPLLPALPPSLWSSTPWMKALPPLSAAPGQLPRSPARVSAPVLLRMSPGHGPRRCDGQILPAVRGGLHLLEKSINEL